MNDDNVKWLTLASDDAEDYVGDVCDTREEAIEQGRDEHDQIELGSDFWVCKGNRVTEGEIAEYLAGVIEGQIDDAALEEVFENGCEEPIIEVSDDDIAALSQLIESWLRDRKLVRKLYRWEPAERISALPEVGT